MACAPFTFSGLPSPEKGPKGGLPKELVKHLNEFFPSKRGNPNLSVGPHYTDLSSEGLLKEGGEALGKLQGKAVGLIL